MDETKIIITVQNGIITSITSNYEIKVMIIDYDNIRSGDAEFPGEDDYYSQDLLVENMYQYYKEKEAEHEKPF